MMKKIICIFSALCCAIIFCACGASGKNADTNKIGKAMTSADKSLPDMKTVSSESENAPELFKSISDLDYGKVQSFYLSYSADGSPYEIALISVKDIGDAAECEKSLRAHLDSRLRLYKNYAPENVKKAEKTVILAEGNVSAYIMCDEREAVKKAFLSALRDEK